MAEGVQFQAFHLCIVFLCLAIIRTTSRRALSVGFRKWLQLKVPPLVSDIVLFLTQWWVILGVVLIVELILTKSSILAIMDATLKVRSDMGWLAVLSRWACPACLVTYALCFFSIAWQVHTAWCDANSDRCGWHRDLKWVMQYPRDVALQVLFMPMVYHLMMCRSLLRRWAVYSDGMWEGQVSHRNLMAADGDASLAEMYDAYVMWCFGNLGMGVADRALRRQTELAGHSSIFTLLQGTLMFGVKAYVVTAVLGALYSIGLAFVILVHEPNLCSPTYPEFPFSAPNATNSSNVTRFLQEEVAASGGDSGVCTFTQVIYGADFATSTIAIYNLFSFEHQLSGPLEPFTPSWKFWSMKIPVTLSFSELMLLKLTQPLTGLSTYELQILDTMTKAYFMMLVSLLNVIAWKPTEEWYYWEELCEESESVGTVPVCPGDEDTSSENDTTEESGQQEEDVEEGVGATGSDREAEAAPNEPAGPEEAARAGDAEQHELLPSPKTWQVRTARTAIVMPPVFLNTT